MQPSRETFLSYAAFFDEIAAHCRDAAATLAARADEANARYRMAIDAVIEAEIQLADALAAYGRDAPPAVADTRLQYHADITAVPAAQSLGDALENLLKLNIELAQAAENASNKHAAQEVAQALDAVRTSITGTQKKITRLLGSVFDI